MAISRPARMIADPIAHAAQPPRGRGDEKKTVRPSRAQVVEDAVEGVLHQRIEPFGRLVEDRELGVVLERLDDADLLAHAARVVAHLSPQDRCPAARAGRTARRDGAARGPGGRRGSRAPARRSASRTARCRPAGSRSGAGSRPTARRDVQPEHGCRAAVGWRKPSSVRIIVDLPAPFGPRKPKISPWFTSSVRSVRAFTEP